MGIIRSEEAKFRGIHVSILALKGLKIKESDVELQKLKRDCEENVRKDGSIETSDILNRYNQFFKELGLDPTKVRPANVSLIRRVRALVDNEHLPEINTFVDSYTIASLQTCIPIGAFDLDKINHDGLAIRKARKMEQFIGIGMYGPKELTGKEFVLEDSIQREILAIYCRRDANFSKITTDTKNAMLVICGVADVGIGKLEDAKKIANEHISRFCT